MTKVKFVIFKGELVAMFPETEFNDFYPNSCMSYMHIGQHGQADKKLMRCKSATKEQYSELLKELIRIGYDDLKVMNKN